MEKIKAIKKVIKVGNSYVIIIPKEIVELLNLKKGDMVVVTFSKIKTKELEEEKKDVE